jgi:hypothetical protein
VNKFLRTLLRTGVYFLDQAEDATAAVRDRVRDQVDGLTDRATQVIGGRENHTARHALSLAAGIGLGIGIGLLFAPARGDKTREDLAGKLQDFGKNVRDRFSHEVKRPGTGTEGS